MLNGKSLSSLSYGCVLVVDYVEIISVLGFILPGNGQTKYREIQC